MALRRCYGCMNMVEQNTVCSHCGFDGRPNALHQLPMGVILKERYLIGRVLGQGGFGITYMGWDGVRNIPVAIKEFFPGGVVHRQSVNSMDVECYTGNVSQGFDRNKKRFVKEANTLAQLKGLPEIVQVIDFFEENNTAYIVMEYVDGITLKDYMKQLKRRLEPQEVIQLLKPLMEALGQVHDLHLIHRDISPDNIMLTRSGGIKLIDFGTVRYMDDSDLSKSTEAILKPGFAPMEQYQNRGKIGPWTDVYALCATMYYCMTGKLPMDAPSRVVEDTEIILQEVIPDVDEKIARAMRLGMANLSGKRLQNVGQLYRILFDTELKGKEPEEKQQEKNNQQKKTRDPKPDEKKPPEAIRKETGGKPAEAPKINTPQTHTNRQDSPRSTPQAPGIQNKKQPVSPPVPQQKKRKKFWLIPAAVVALVIGLALLQSNDTVGAILETIAESSLATVAQEGWVTEGYDTFYYQDNEPVVGWFDVDGARYYADEYGRVAFNRAVLIGADTYHFDGQGKVQAISYGSLSSTWAERPFYFGNSSGEERGVDYRELKQPVENCTGFTFSAKVTHLEAGTADGQWRVCLRINGQWERFDLFDVVNQEGTVTVRLDEPISFDAFTAYRDTRGYFLGKCYYEMTDVMVNCSK